MNPAGYIPGFVFLMLLIIMNSACNKENQSLLQPSSSVPSVQNGVDMSLPQSRDFETINLVSDTVGFNALRVDPNAGNVWGVSFGPDNGIRICCNHTGLAVLYDGFGKNLSTPVNVPLNNDPTGGSPTGVIYNNSSDFMIPGTGQRSQFIFATEDGNIFAWTQGGKTVLVVNRTSFRSVYKGLAMARSGGANFLYATDFRRGRVDVFNSSFTYMPSISFVDPNLPEGYAPFGIQNIDNKLYISYAKQKGPDNMDDQKGPGHGFVDIFNTDGSMVGRFVSRGALNSPWALAEVPSSHHSIMIGNFGDGKINTFDSSGNFLGPLQHNRQDLVVDGLWSIVFPPAGFGGMTEFGFYYTAGPDDEDHGVFGFIAKDDF